MNIRECSSITSACLSQNADVLEGGGGSLAQQRLSEVGQLFVCYVFDLDVSVKYLKVTFSYTQKSVKFRSGFIFYKNVN